MNEPAYRSRPGVPPIGTRLCGLADIKDPGAKGFVFGEGTERFDMFIVRRGADLAGYVNECPHALTPLDTWPDKFLTQAGDQIICSTHAALFEIATGFCTSGPCAGKKLEPIPLEIRDEAIFIA